MGNMESHQMVRYGICVFQIFAGLGCFWFIPSGKHTKNCNYGTSPFLMGKLTISMAIFNSKLLVYQRVTPNKIEKKMTHVPPNLLGLDFTFRHVFVGVALLCSLASKEDLTRFWRTTFPQHHHY